MRMRRVVSVLGLVVALQVGLPRGAAAQSPAEVVIEWNRIMQVTLAIPGALPATIFVTRPFAVLHVAMFDALNSIDYTFREYAVRATAAATASREVAAAKAARDVMVSMFPAQAAIFDAALALTVARFPGEAGTQGALVGAAAARAILAARVDDGWIRAAQQPYILPDLPGYWQPVPPQNATATLVHYQDVRPFVLGSRMQFMVEAPPALTSQRYADDFNEVKSLGGVTSTVRTADQTQTAQRWAGVGYSTSAFGIWYNLGRDLARTRTLSGVDTARVFALLAITQHDALLTSFSGKFIYGLWRPTTAIRNAHRDNNPATEVDANFVSLIATPPYPAYPGNMACIGASSSALFARVWGRDDIAFAATWAGIAQPDVTRSYNGFRQLADEEARSRIYAGIHFTFDHTPASVRVRPSRTTRSPITCSRSSVSAFAAAASWCSPHTRRTPRLPWPGLGVFRLGVVEVALDALTRAEYGSIPSFGSAPTIPAAASSNWAASRTTALVGVQDSGLTDPHPGKAWTASPQVLGREEGVEVASNAPCSLQ